jgi:small conductance mechanosensitive channel
MDNAMEQVNTFIVTYGIRVVGAIVFLIVGRMIAGFVKGLIKRVLGGRGIDAAVSGFLANLVYALVLVGVLIAVLGQFGVETASFVAVLGAAGFAVGFALQGSLSNFASGVMLLVFKPFKAGDFVDAAGVAGTVAEIQLFDTILNTPDNVRIIVPNAQIYGGTIKNFSANDKRRVDFSFGIGYGSSIEEAISTIHNLVGADSRIDKEPEPFYGVGELADSSVNITVRVWCNKADYWDIKFDLTRKVKDAFDSKGIEIPFPQQTIWHQNQMV